MFSSGALPAAGLCVTVKGVPVEEYCFICVTIGGRRRWCVNRTTHHFVLFALQRGRQYTVQGGRERIHRAINVLQLVQAEQTHSERRRASIHAVLGVFIQLPRHLCRKWFSYRTSGTCVNTTTTTAHVRRQQSGYPRP